MKRPIWTASVVPVPLLLLACASSTPPAQPGRATKETSTATAPVDPNDPLAPTMLMREGQALAAEGRVDEGLVRFRAALKLQPANPTIYNLIGQAELRRRDNVKALEAFNQALALAPTYTDARNNRGATYVALGQLSLAEADFLSALTDNLYANRAGVYYNLGALYVARANFAAAEENLRRAAVPAGPVEAYVLLGQVQQRLEKPELAETSFRSAVERAPERVDIAMLLAAHLEARGRKDEARTLYRRVLELGPGSPEAAEARARLGP
jgi:Flp pilus assembly protein TadD